MRKHQRPAPTTYGRRGGRTSAATLLVLLFAAGMLLAVSALPWLLSPQYHVACHRIATAALPARVDCEVQRRLWWLIVWDRQPLQGVSAAGLHTVRQPRGGKSGGEIEQHWLTLNSAPQQRLLLLIDEDGRHLADELQGFIDSGRSTLDTGTHVRTGVAAAVVVFGSLGLACLLRLLQLLLRRGRQSGKP